MCSSGHHLQDSNGKESHATSKSNPLLKPKAEGLLLALRHEVAKNGHFQHPSDSFLSAPSLPAFVPEDSVITLRLRGFFLLVEAQGTKHHLSRLEVINGLQKDLRLSGVDRQFLRSPLGDLMSGYFCGIFCG